LLRAILDQKEGVVPPLLGKIGANREHLLQATDSLLERIPSVFRGGERVRPIFRREPSRFSIGHFQEAEQMKDEYVSLEHILLAILEEKEGKAAAILVSSGITREAILQALVDIRGGQRITESEP